MGPAAVPKRARRRRLGLVLLVLLALLVVLEALSQLGLGLLHRKLDLRTVSFPADPGYYDRVLRSPRFRHDPDLGWDRRNPVRPLPGLSPPGPPFAAAYGDSFTYCAEVKDDKTWEHQLSLLAGRRVLNLGVNAYGTDQAYLKLLKYHGSHPARVVMLGILPENINRLVGVVRKFYFRLDEWPFVKPRFVLDEKGDLLLISNPIRDPRALNRLSRPEYLEELSRHDFWYQLARERHGFDLVRGRSFPALFDILHMGVGLLRGGGRPVHYRDFYREQGSEPMRIMRALLYRFKRSSRELGFSPVVIMHAADQDLRDSGAMRGFQQLIKRELGLPLLDVCGVFWRAVREQGVRLPDLYRPLSHYSELGNRLLARGLFALLARHRLLPGMQPGL